MRRMLVSAVVCFSLAVPLVAQEIHEDLYYKCNGERVAVRCAFDDKSDAAPCTASYPDRPKPRGFTITQSTTRGAVRKLFATCTPPDAEAIRRGEEFERSIKQSQEQAVEAQKQYARDMQARQAGGTNADPGTLAARRCAAAGRSLTECMGEALNTSLGAIAPTAARKIVAPGLRLNGIYTAASGIRVMISPGTSYDIGSASVACGKIEGTHGPYLVSIRNGAVVVTVPNQPAPLTFTVRPDGSLAGPASATVSGRVIVGYTKGGGTTMAAAPTQVLKTETHSAGEMVSGLDVTQGKYSSSDVSNTAYGTTVLNKNVTTQTWETVPSTTPVVSGPSPIYENRTEQCGIGTLASQGSAARAPVSSVAAGVANVMGQAANNVDVPPGLRMAGIYRGADNTRIEFRGDVAILECGEVQFAPRYSVEQTGGQVLVRLRGQPPLDLAYRPDGSLAEPGRMQLMGRVMTGAGPGGQPTFAPRPATCWLGTLTPASQ